MRGRCTDSLGVYNVSYIVGLFGEPNKAVYAANMERNIDTSGVLMMDYSGFKAVALPRNTRSLPLHHSGHEGLHSAKIHPELLRRCDLPSQRGQGGALQPERGRPRQAAEFEAFYRAMTAGDQELCARMLDTIAVSRVLTVARRSAGCASPATDSNAFFSGTRPDTITRFKRFEYSPKTRKERAGLRRIRQQRAERQQRKTEL